MLGDAIDLDRSFMDRLQRLVGGRRCLVCRDLRLMRRRFGGGSPRLSFFGLLDLLLDLRLRRTASDSAERQRRD